MKMDTDNTSKGFISAGERADKVFKYLNKVRESDRDLEDYSPQEMEKVRNTEDPLADNTYSRNFVDRLPHISSDSRAFSPTTGQSIDYTGHIMPGNRVNRKIASQPTGGFGAAGTAAVSAAGIKAPDSALRRFGKNTFGDMDRFITKYTVNPAIQSLIYGGIAGLGTYMLAPTANRALGVLAKLLNKGEGGKSDESEDEGEELSQDDRWSTALIAGLGVGALNLARHIDYKNPSWDNLWHFYEHRPRKPYQPPRGVGDLPVKAGIKKGASMLGPVDYVPKSFAMNAVTLDPNIPDYLKYTTLNVLGNTDGGNDAPINSTDIVMSSINSGMSGRAGLPLGRIAVSATADALAAYGLGSLFGVKDPGTLARNVGLGSAALRGIDSLL